MTTVRVSFSEVMVHGQFSGIRWHSSSILSHFGARFTSFCGIYSLFKINKNFEIKKGMILVTITILGLNFQRFGCEQTFPIQKLLGDRLVLEVGL